MENSKFETLKLPPHRRRPLRSQTFPSLLRILAIFHDSPQQSHPPASNPGSGGTESGAATRSDGDLAHANIMSNKYLFQHESLVGETQSVLGMQERGQCNTHEEIVGSNHTMRKGNKEMAHEDNTNLVKPLGNKNRDISLLTCDIEDQSSVQRLTGECTGKTEVDHKLPTREIPYANNSSLEGHKMGILNPAASNNEKNRLVDMNALEGAEDEQVTGMVLEEPISNSGASDSFLNLNADKEVEEGEISGEIVDFSLVDDLSSEEKKREKGHFSKEIHGKEHGKSNLFSINMTNNVVKGIEAEIREPKRNLVEYDSEIFIHAKPVQSVKLNEHRGKFNTGETKKLGSGVKKFGSPAVCLKNLVHVAGASGDHTPNILDIVSNKKDADTRNMKKRQCPPAKEKKANKKICSSHDKIELVVLGNQLSLERQKVMGIGLKLYEIKSKALWLTSLLIQWFLLKILLWWENRPGKICLKAKKMHPLIRVYSWWKNGNLRVQGIKEGCTRNQGLESGKFEQKKKARNSSRKFGTIVCFV